MGARGHPTNTSQAYRSIGARGHVVYWCLYHRKTIGKPEEIGGLMGFNGVLASGLISHMAGWKIPELNGGF